MTNREDGCKLPLIDLIAEEAVRNPHLQRLVKRLKNCRKEYESSFAHHRDGHNDYSAHPDVDPSYACD